MPSTIENNYGALASESNDTWDNKQSKAVEKKSSSRRLVSIIALAVACIGVALLVSSTNHYSSISKNKSITSLSKVTYTTEEETASYTHAPTPSSFDNDITRSPTPINLHPTASPVEEKIKKRDLKNNKGKNFVETHQPTPTMFGKETFNPTPYNRNPSFTGHPTEEPSERKRSHSRNMKGSETYNPTSKGFPETHNPTPKTFGKESLSY